MMSVSGATTAKRNMETYDMRLRLAVVSLTFTVAWLQVSGQSVLDLGCHGVGHGVEWKVLEEEGGQKGSEAVKCSKAEWRRGLTHVKIGCDVDEDDVRSDGRTRTGG
jgi:hypothetical protein